MNCHHKVEKLPWVVWNLAGVSVFVMFGFGFALPLIPIHSHQLGASSMAVGLIVGAFFAGRIIAHFPAGRLLSYFGYKPVIASTLVGYCISYLGFAFSSSLALLVVSRLIQGIGAGLFSVSARVLINDACTSQNRGLGQSLYSAAVSIGFILGPVAGTAIAQTSSIPMAFVVCAGLSALVLSVGLFLPIPTVRIDVPERAPARRVLLRRFFPLLIVNLVFMAALGIVKVLFPILGAVYLKNGMDVIGISLTAAGASGFIMAPVIGRLMDRFNREPVVVTGVLLTALEGIVLYTNDSAPAIITAFVLGGMGVSAFTIGLHATVGDATHPNERAFVASQIGMAGEIGGVVGTLGAVTLYSAVSIRFPFIIQALLLLGTASFLVLGARARHDSGFDRTLDAMKPTLPFFQLPPK